MVPLRVEASLASEVFEFVFLKNSMVELRHRYSTLTEEAQAQKELPESIVATPFMGLLRKLLSGEPWLTSS